jgi:hypothetical protein
MRRLKAPLNAIAERREDNLRINFRAMDCPKARGEEGVN